VVHAPGPGLKRRRAIFTLSVCLPALSAADAFTTMAGTKNNKILAPTRPGPAMKLVMTVVLVAAALLLWRAVDRRRNKRTTTPSRALAHAPDNHPWRATSIIFDDDACAAVKAIGRHRFLDAERDVPQLPVPGCDVAKCRCRYAHHEDRRKDNEDRRHPAALHTELYEASGKHNRREGRRGRRKNDWS